MSQSTIECADEYCSHCGGTASTEFEGRDGSFWPVCVECDAHLREQEAEASDHEDDVVCEDCQCAAAVRIFLHLSGREYMLCEECFADADHEEEYLR